MLVTTALIILTVVSVGFCVRFLVALSGEYRACWTCYLVRLSSRPIPQSEERRPTARAA
jgi:hypothetical protein